MKCSRCDVEIKDAIPGTLDGGPGAVITCARCAGYPSLEERARDFVRGIGLVSEGRQGVREVKIHGDWQGAVEQALLHELKSAVACALEKPTACEKDSDDLTLDGEHGFAVVRWHTKARWHEVRATLPKATLLRFEGDDLDAAPRWVRDALMRACRSYGRTKR